MLPCDLDATSRCVRSCARPNVSFGTDGAENNNVINPKMVMTYLPDELSIHSNYRPKSINSCNSLRTPYMLQSHEGIPPYVES